MSVPHGLPAHSLAASFASHSKWRACPPYSKATETPGWPQPTMEKHEQNRVPNLQRLRVPPNMKNNNERNTVYLETSIGFCLYNDRIILFVQGYHQIPRLFLLNHRILSKPEAKCLPY